MIFKFKNTFIPRNKKLINSLKRIYGIGYSKSSYILSIFGLNNKFDSNSLNRYYFDCISNFLKHNYSLEDRLKFLTKSRFIVMSEAGVIRYDRYIHGLPINGQRTHTNGKTPKKMKKFIAN